MNLIVNLITGGILTTPTTTMKKVTCLNRGSKRVVRNRCPWALMRSLRATRMINRHLWDRLKEGQRILKPNLRIITKLWFPDVSLFICATSPTLKKQWRISMSVWVLVEISWLRSHVTGSVKSLALRARVNITSRQWKIKNRWVLDSLFLLEHNSNPTSNIDTGYIVGRHKGFNRQMAETVVWKDGKRI